MADKVRVFLSYRRADTQHVAGRAADRLGEFFELFMDIDTIPPGVDFEDYVRRAVSSCDVLLAFIGNRWADLSNSRGQRRLDDPQDWVAEEIGVALGRGVRVIPVLVDDAVMPLADDLPSALAPLAHRQALPLRHATFSADLARLVAGIEHASRERGAPAATGSTAASTSADPAVRPGGNSPARFAERWEQPGMPTRAGPAVTIGQETPPPRLRAVVLGLALVLLAALIGAGIAIGRPFDHSAVPQAEETGGSPRSSSSPTPSPALPGPAVTPAHTVEELRAHVPAAFRRTCRALVPEPKVLKASLVVAVQCLPTQGSLGGRQPTYLFYFQYAGPESALAAFRGYYASGDLPAGDCSHDPAEMPYDRPDQGGGILRCYRDAEAYRVLAWTDDELAIVASAADRTMTYAELVRWWRGAGPVR
ncbi:hypothetical protein GCM10009841_31560 [Microlunatus panaciterrae]|uniref:TIR domain-containing protein n=1 Tax=Microlunatus panaciterrae TaxID=400768 RepID=A0ABS2RFN7_9ACTN|nr:toll/interleukin-1 receptor domain-containing protein [Microlunatus panaciterrae]MBM7797815.1 hypothetical protein [Microlunatus panaciterrae]